MSRAIAPIRAVRGPERRARPETAPTPARVEVTIRLGEDDAPRAASPPAPPGPSAEAHLIAQGARVRGLRGGPKVLQTARAAYLETEWSGPNDRRVPAGRLAKTQA